MQDAGTGKVKACERTLEIIGALRNLDEATLTELANDLDMPRSTLHGYLSAMMNQQYIVKDGQSYRLGLKFVREGMNAKENNTLYKPSNSILNQLAQQTDEMVWLVIEEYGKAVCLRKAKGDLAVQPYKKVGKRLHLHNIAAGKAILADLPEERVRSIIDQHGLPRYTEETITDTDRLFEELERVREDGVAFNDGESMEGFRAVASSVCLDGEVLGSIVVSGPKNRFRGDRFRNVIPESITGAANALELELVSETRTDNETYQ